MTDQKLKEDMFRLLGKLDAIAFPLLLSESKGTNQPYYDLIDSIINDYEDILSRITGDKHD